MHLVNNFDDLVVYLGENELYGEICEYLSLAANSNSPEPFMCIIGLKVPICLLP